MPSVINADLQRIPGVGASIAQDFLDIGIHGVTELCGKDALAMYDQLIKLRGEHQDRCVLYVFRCAVYFAENLNHDSELFKWWNWKD